jgi:argininosuccinate lyase
MSKIWQKNKELDRDAEIFCSFTTGNDYQLDDVYFLKYDIDASVVWVQALLQAGIYNKEEATKVIDALMKIGIDHEQGDFFVKQTDEDCHTAIEKRLIEMTGDLGKKIHTGRSRNDQSLTMIRLFMRDTLTEIIGDASTLNLEVSERFIEWFDQVFIGYSHTQQAMPITVGYYFMSFKESLLDDISNIISVSNHVNVCPLGTGAGFGTPINIDRDFIAAGLGFREVQNNSLYCQNSRGKFELLYIQSLMQVMLTLQRLASDMVLYTSREYSLFKMSDSLSQGSSMMPQKKNPDVFEMIRAKTADVMALEERVKFIIKGLPSGYNRDLQEIKACIVDAYNITKNCIYITKLAIKHIEPNPEMIEKRLEKDIVAADYVISKCVQDPALNFRDLYKDFMEDNYMSLKPEDAVRLRKSKGSPNNL